MQDETAMRLADAIMQQSTQLERNSAALVRFEALLATGAPNLVERVSGGRPQHAVAALIVVAAVAALVASCTTLLWVAPWVSI